MKWLLNQSTKTVSSILGSALFRSSYRYTIIKSSGTPCLKSKLSLFSSLVVTNTFSSGRSLHRLPCTNASHHRGVTQPHPYIQVRTMATSNTSAAALVESAKKSAAYQAVNDHLLPEYKYVGIGSGSTVVYVVDAIVSKGPEFYSKMTFIPTGSQSKDLIRKAGLNLANLDERPVVDGKPVALDVAFDGADEVDEDLNLIKGGGACLFQEKLVAIAAKKFIAVADYRKQSPRLCTTWKTIPIEVLPMAAPDVLIRLREMGSPNPAVRSGLPSKAGECVTDNGMWLIDAPFAPLLLPKDLNAETEGRGKDGVWEISTLADELLKLPGIVEIGLFHGFNGDQAVKLAKQLQAQKPVAAYFGLANGEVSVQKAG